MLTDNQEATTAPDAPEVGTSNTPAPTTAEKSDTPAPASPSGDTAEAAAKTPATQSDSVFPANWRELMAGDDAKLLKQLGRYASPKAVADAHKVLNDRVLGGEFKKVLGKDATPEDVAQWRKENGVPDKPEAYYQAIEQDVSIPEEHKPVFDAFFEKIHGSNLNAEQTKTVVSTYYELLAQKEAQQQEEDAGALDKSAAILRQEWGGEFTKNMTIVDSYLDTVPTPVAESLKNGRGADGVLLKHNPEVVRWLSQLAYEANPAVNLVPSTHSNPIEGVKERMTEIETMMKSRDRATQDKYFKNPELQAEYGRLTEALSKMKK